MTDVVGIDACKRGWIAVALRDGAFIEATIHAHLDHAAQTYQSCAVVGVDIPIGLPDGTAWARQADIEARKLVGARRNSVFMTMPAIVLAAPTHQEAIDTCTSHGRPKISAQAYALKARINEAADLAAADDRIYEVHPEVCFREIAGMPLAHSKRTWAGLIERIELLEAVGIEIPSQLGDAGASAPDDVVDAAAAAWTANRIAVGIAASLPRSAVSDRRSHRIWY